MNTHLQLSDSMFQWWGEQNQLFEKWLKSEPFFSGKGVPGADLMGEAVDMWEKAVDDGLMAQAVWSAQLREMVDRQEFLPKEMKDIIAQMQEFNDRWRGEREKMWHMWFEMFKTYGLGQTAGDGDRKKPPQPLSLESGSN